MRDFAHGLLCKTLSKRRIGLASRLHRCRHGCDFLRAAPECDPGAVARDCRPGVARNLAAAVAFLHPQGCGMGIASLAPWNPDACGSLGPVARLCTLQPPVSLA